MNTICTSSLLASAPSGLRNCVLAWVRTCFVARWPSRLPCAVTRHGFSGRTPATRGCDKRPNGGIHLRLHHTRVSHFLLILTLSAIHLLGKAVMACRGVRQKVAPCGGWRW